MVLLANNEDFSAASGLLNIPLLEGIYHSVMDETYANNGLARTVRFHLPPSLEQDDTNTQSAAPAQQYNPWFGGTPVPQANTRRTGAKVTTRDVDYQAQIRVGPKGADDTNGIGDLKDNEAVITVAIEALSHVKEALSVTIEGRRYSIKETRPIGFNQRRYLMCFLDEINETETPSPDGTIG